VSIKTWSSPEEFIHQVVTLTQQGSSRRAIARALGVGRNTVRAVLEAHGEQRQSIHVALPQPRQRAPRASKLDPFRKRIDDLLCTYPDITAQRVFEILQMQHGFDGGYTAVKKYLRRVRPKSKPKPSRATPVYGPGEMSETDWTPHDVTFTDGAVMSLVIFSYVLVFSRRKYLRPYPGEGLHPLMDGQQRAFERFGGCAHISKLDGQKAVLLRMEGRQPIYNPRYLAFCTHYEMRPLVQLGNPNLRPRVERSFWEGEKSFFNARSFRDFNDLERQMAEWLDRIVDHRPRHGTTALQRFELERPHLRPLPRHPYDTARVEYRLCSIDGFIDWQGNRYAVPYDHVTDILPVRITQQELFVYGADLKCIARHELAPRGAHAELDPAGFHRPASRTAASDADQLVDAFQSLGPHGPDFIQFLSAAPPRRWRHQARRILLLRARYATEHLDAALGHALRFGVSDAAAVERILALRHPARRLDQYVAEQIAARLDGQPLTTPRDLAEYDCHPDDSGALSAPVQESTPCASETATANPKAPDNPSLPPSLDHPTSSDCTGTCSSSD